MTDFLDEKRKEIADRLKDLKPAVDEYNRLEAAASALEGVGGTAATATATATTPRRRGPGRPRGSVSRKGAAAAAADCSRRARQTRAQKSRQAGGAASRTP